MEQHGNRIIFNQQERTLIEDLPPSIIVEQAIGIFAEISDERAFLQHELSWHTLSDIDSSGSPTNHRAIVALTEKYRQLTALRSELGQVAAPGFVELVIEEAAT